MNSNDLLVDYRDRADFPAIAQQTAAWVNAHPDATEADVLAWVAARFGKPEVVKMNPRPTPFALFGAPETQIPVNAIEQMETVMRLPMARAGALMPDAHLGYAMPIGGVVSLDGAISPSFVGYDISCMMQLTLFDITPEAFMAERAALAEALRSVTAFGVGSDFKPGERKHAVMDDPLWREIHTLTKLQSKARRQLGSSGGGNHFADLVVMEFLVDYESYAAGDVAVALLTHSGSRGTGHNTAVHYVKAAQRMTRHIAKGVPKGYEWLPLDSEAGQEYLAAMTLMGRYARANHDLIHAHFGVAAGLEPLHRVWNRHNYAWVDEAGMVIHRKGATPAAAGQMGIIPGSSGTPSYLVRGLGNAASLHSSSHGAGRFFSRKEAKRRHDRAARSRVTWRNRTSSTLAWKRMRPSWPTRTSTWSCVYRMACSSNRLHACCPRS